MPSYTLNDLISAMREDGESSPFVGGFSAEYVDSLLETVKERRAELSKEEELKKERAVEKINEIVELKRATLFNPSVTPLTIGSDPEFCIIENNRLVPADGFISDPNRNRPFGLDGNAATGEIRPGYATKPLNHVKNIRKVLAEGLKSSPDIANFNVVTAYPYKPIGGHIGFGHVVLKNPHLFSLTEPTDRIISEFVAKYSNSYNVNQSLEQGNIELILPSNNFLSFFLKKLDVLLALPVLFIEDRNDAIGRRLNSGYGKLSNYRSQGYGIEYRTLPSWIANPKVAKGVTSLAYVVAHDSIYTRKVNQLPSLSSNMFYGHELDKLDNTYQKVKEIVKTLPLYSKYKKHIDFIFKNADERNPIIHGDIIKGWKLTPKIVKEIVLLTVGELVKEFTRKVKNTGTLEKQKQRFVYGDFNHYEIGHIANRVNYTLGKLTKLTPEKKVYIFGSGEDVNKIIIRIAEACPSRKRTHRLPQLINAVAKILGYTSPIDVQIKYVPNMSGITLTIGYETIIRGDSVNAIVRFSRDIREHGSYLPETIVFLILLFVNNTIYKAYKVKSGRKITLPILIKALVEPIKDNLSSQFKHVEPDPRKELV